jgi:2-haloacid dehalogenase
MKHYEYLLIDADGTFLDFEKTELNALNSTVDYVGWKNRGQFISTFIDINKKVWAGLEEGKVDPGQINSLRFEGLHRELSKTGTLSRTAGEMGEYYLAQLGEGDYLMEGAREFLDYLKGKYTMILATNGLAWVQRARLRKAGLESYFDRVAISQELGCHKPMPEFFSRALEGYDYRKEDVLMIGDSLASDMAGADAFGIDGCWFNSRELLNDGTASPAYEIARLEEVRGIL